MENHALQKPNTRYFKMDLGTFLRTFASVFFCARPFSLHIFSTFLNDCGNGWGTKTDAIVGF